MFTILSTSEPKKSCDDFFIVCNLQKICLRRLQLCAHLVFGCWGLHACPWGFHRFLVVGVSLNPLGYAPMIMALGSKGPAETCMKHRSSWLYANLLCFGRHDPTIHFLHPVGGFIFASQMIHVVESDAQSRCSENRCSENRSPFNNTICACR